MDHVELQSFEDFNPEVEASQTCREKFLSCVNPTEVIEPSVANPLCPGIGRWTKRISKRPCHQTFTRAFIVFSYLTLACLIWLGSGAATTELGPAKAVSCDQSFWDYDRCGVNGANCLPFESDWTPIRCDALCIYKTGWNVIGTQYYRADSQICQSATHAGVIGPMGGCFLVRLTGSQTNFSATESNGVLSIGWSSYFPKSFEWVILGTFLCIGLVLLLLRVPKWLFLLSIIHFGWWYIGFSGDKDTPHGDVWINQIFTRMLPSFAFTVVLHKFGNKAILGPDFPIDNFFLYLIPSLLFMHMNYVTFFLDFDLTGDSLTHLSTPAIICITTIIVVGVCLAIPQIWFLWKSGRFFKFLLGYSLFGGIIAIVVVSLRNHFEFHFHHYMIALLFWPATALNTRSSTLNQAILLGVFINGAARWGFGSFFDIPKPHHPMPGMLWFSSRNLNTVSFEWENKCQAYSLWMNDFEVYRGAETHATVELPATGMELIYYFCVRCLYEGVLSSSCSEFVELVSH